MLANKETFHFQVLQTISNQARDTLSHWLLDSHTFAKLEIQFQQEILEPAIRLHQDIRISTYRYQMDERDIPTGLSSRDMLDQWSLKDVDTWGPIKKGSEDLKRLGCLHPPLIRIRNSDGVAVNLSKPVMVVSVLPPRSKVRTHEHNGEETANAYSESKSSDTPNTPTVAQQIIREEEVADSSSVSASSDREYKRKKQRSDQRESRRQNSNKGSKTHAVRYSEGRLSSPEKRLAAHRTLSPDTFFHAAPRDGGRQRRESRSRTAQEHEQPARQSSRSSAVEVEPADQHIILARPYNIEEIEPEGAHPAASHHRDTSGPTSPSSGRRTPVAMTRQLRKESSRSREKRLSSIALDGHVTSSNSATINVPPADNPGVWSVLKQKVSTSGPWRNPG